MKDGGKCENPTIQRLLSNMRLISVYNPESFGRKVAKRHQLFGQIVRLGILAIWFTINPSDLKNPVVRHTFTVFNNQWIVGNIVNLFETPNPKVGFLYFCIK